MLNIKSKEYETMIKEMKQGKVVVITPWGRAKKSSTGRYHIINGENNKKQVHTLIWESFYGKKIPKDYDLHHQDTNYLNNAIQNLQCVQHSKHVSFHSKGENHPMWGKHHSEESKKKMSESRKKYNLWDGGTVFYSKIKMFQHNREPNPCKCFKLKYNKKFVHIGYFHDFVSVEIINDLIDEAI